MDPITEGAVNVVLATMDLCGNESEALKNYCAENKIELTNDFRFEVMGEVQARWQASQAAARVRLFDEA